MADDITDRLRVASESASVGFMPWASLMRQARDEIIRLRAVLTIGPRSDSVMSMNNTTATQSKPTLIKSTDRYELWSWKNCVRDVAELTDEMTEAMTTCTAAEDISFSYMSGSGIDGHQVSCFRTIAEPKMDSEWRELLPGHGAVLDTRGEVRRFGLLMGYVVEYRRKPRSI